jgi:hypothetical protein
MQEDKGQDCNSENELTISVISDNKHAGEANSNNTQTNCTKSGKWTLEEVKLS